MLTILAAPTLNRGCIKQIAETSLIQIRGPTFWTYEGAVTTRNLRAYGTRRFCRSFGAYGSRLCIRAKCTRSIRLGQRLFRGAVQPNLAVQLPTLRRLLFAKYAFGGAYGKTPCPLNLNPSHPSRVSH